MFTVKKLRNQEVCVFFPVVVVMHILMRGTSFAQQPGTRLLKRSGWRRGETPQGPSGEFAAPSHCTTVVVNPRGSWSPEHRRFTPRTTRLPHSVFPGSPKPRVEVSEKVGAGGAGAGKEEGNKETEKVFFKKHLDRTR